MGSHHHSDPASSLVAQHVIVTPIWLPRPDDVATRLLHHSFAANPGIQVVLVGPRGLDIGFYREQFPQASWQPFAEEAFLSVQAYSRWMTCPELYQSLSGFEFMTVCQQDAVLLQPVTCVPMDELDYIGSPWVPPVRVLRVGKRISVASDLGQRQGPIFTSLFGKRIFVGNGGLSTRRVPVMIKVSRILDKSFSDSVRSGLLEDLYFCALGPRVGLRVAGAELAKSVFAESTAADLADVGDLVGLHGSHVWNPGLLARLLGS